MDMYQKRKIRAEKKNMGNEENLSKVIINHYPGHMAKTKRLIKENLPLIDIVYEVVDSRIPYSSKITDIDDYTKNKPKIIIFTKDDLCDKEETKKWKEYYQKQGNAVISLNLEANVNIKPLITLTEKIMKEENKKREAKGLLKRKARVLVVGVPNVGKSTLINRLSLKKVVNTGNKPGITKNISWIRVNDKIELLDTPGILWPKLTDRALGLAAFTAIKEEILPLYDVTEYILRMLEKYYPNILKERFSLEYLHDDIIEDLEIIGKKRGCLVSGGEVDYDKVIKVIMNDIKLGYIKGITFDRYDELN